MGKDKPYFFSGKRIYYVYFHDPRFIPIHTSEVIDEMARQGADVSVFTYVRDKELQARLRGKSTRLLNMWTPNMRFFSEIIFMAHLLPNLFFFMLFCRPDLVYTRHSAVSFVAALCAKILRIPCFMEVNDIVADKLKFGNVSFAKRQWLRLYHALNYKTADLLLPVTQAISDHVIKSYDLDPAKVCHIPNGVNPNRFSPKDMHQAKKRLGLNKDTKVILCLGSLFPWAGMHTLVDAAPDILDRHPNARFVIGSGEEPYLSQVKQAVENKGLGGSFVFCGFIPWDEAAWFISAADVCAAPFVFKNIRSGISSLRVFSYLACGRPVVGTNIPGLGDVLTENHMGFSIPMEDAPALAHSINNILDDPEKAQKMGSRAREFAIKKHSWETVVTQIAEKLEERS